MKAEYELGLYRAALEYVVREEREPALPEEVVQRFWYDHAPEAGELVTLEGQRVEVLSPGWWNHCAGPDFQGAQLRFNGTLFTGDVEIHLDQSCWRQHGHHDDARYENVLLHVLLNPPNPSVPVYTKSGRSIPHLGLDTLCTPARGTLRLLKDVELSPSLAPRCHGSCNRFVSENRPEILTDFIHLSGTWRLLNKTRYVQERLMSVGADQAAWELLSRALGYRIYADVFERLARALPYARAVQLSRQAPFLLEAALLHLAGLLPKSIDADQDTPPHVQRLVTLRDSHLPQLKALDLAWSYGGVRPNNYPGRRIAGLANVLGRVARDGFVETLDRLWKSYDDPITLRRAFEDLFPGAMGFWATHYRLDRKAMPKGSAPVGTGRVRSIIGNVFVPLALARARMAGQRSWEEQILAFYEQMPMEPDNQIYKRMQPRILGDHKFRFGFQEQQGVLQIHEDWCKANPSCRNCSLLAYLEGSRR